MENNKKSNTIAIVGFILSFFIAIPALICSIIGLKKSKELNNGKGFSIAGIIISSVKIVLGILVTVLLVIAYYYGDKVVVEDKENNAKTYDRGYYPSFDSTYTLEDVKKFAKENNLEFDINYITRCDKEGQLEYSDGYVNLYRSGKKTSISDNESIKPNDKLVANVCKKVMKEYTDSVLDLNSINTSKELSMANYSVYELDTITESKKEFDFYGNKDELLTVENNNGSVKVSFISKNNPEENLDKNFSNIKKIYYYSTSSCYTGTKLYLISEEKVYILKIPGDNYKNYIEVRNNNYDSIYNVELGATTCENITLPLGHLSDNTFYDLVGNTKFDKKDYYHYSDSDFYIKTDRSYKIGKSTGKVKYAIFSGIIDELNYIIDENNIIYQINWTENGYELNKLTTKKVSKIHYNNEKLYAILELEDGTYFEDSLNEIIIN